MKTLQLGLILHLRPAAWIDAWNIGVVMSKGLQWVIGIGVVLVVAALVFSSVAPFFLPRAAPSGAPLFSGPFTRVAPRFPFLPGFRFGPGRLGTRMPFLGLFGLAGCIWPLLLAGLIILAISLFSRRPAPLPVAPAPLVAPAFTPAQPAAPAAAPSQAVCANCGQPLQPGWRHCPNCGTPVAGAG
jgi:zinc-ribbon domain